MDISPDRATVLVGGETARSVKDKSEEPQGYTLELSLVKVDGSWLVDRAPCNVVENPTCEASSGPADGATTAPPSSTPDDKGSKGPRQKKSTKQGER